MPRVLFKSISGAWFLKSRCFLRGTRGPGQRKCQSERSRLESDQQGKYRELCGKASCKLVQTPVTRNSTLEETCGFQWGAVSFYSSPFHAPNSRRSPRQVSRKGSMTIPFHRCRSCNHSRRKKEERSKAKCQIQKQRTDPRSFPNEANSHKAGSPTHGHEPDPKFGKKKKKKKRGRGSSQSLNPKQGLGQPHPSSPSPCLAWNSRRAKASGQSASRG